MSLNLCVAGFLKNLSSQSFPLRTFRQETDGFGESSGDSISLFLSKRLVPAYE